MRAAKTIWKNYKEPTPDKWRKRGDYALVLLASIQIAIASAPAEVLTIRQSYWISLILTLVITSYKFWTNTQTNED